MNISSENTYPYAQAPDKVGPFIPRMNETGAFWAVDCNQMVN